MDATRRAELDHLFSHVLGGQVVRVKLWSKDGTVTYSNDATLIGDRYPSEEIADVVAGDPKTEVGRLNDEGGSGENIKALSAYTPVRIEGSGEPVGVLELYTRFDEVNADAMATVKPVAIALVLALLLLYASLFPILRQVAGALEARTRRLQQQSDELEKSITERKRALASLREADARYRALVEELPLVSYVSSLDTPGLSTYVSPQLEDMLGYTPEEWLADARPLLGGHPPRRCRARPQRAPHRLCERRDLLHPVPAASEERSRHLGRGPDPHHPRR